MSIWPLRHDQRWRRLLAGWTRGLRREGLPLLVGIFILAGVWLGIRGVENCLPHPPLPQLFVKLQTHFDDTLKSLEQSGETNCEFIKYQEGYTRLRIDAYALLAQLQGQDSAASKAWKAALEQLIERIDTTAVTHRQLSAAGTCMTAAQLQELRLELNTSLAAALRANP